MSNSHRADQKFATNLMNPTTHYQLLSSLFAFTRTGNHSSDHRSFSVPGFHSAILLEFFELRDASCHRFGYRCGDRNRHDNGFNYPVGLTCRLALHSPIGGMVMANLLHSGVSLVPAILVTLLVSAVIGFS